MSLSSPVHQAPRRHHAAEHLGDAGRRGGVHDAAGLAAAADRLPGDLRQRGPAGRESRRRWPRRWRRRSNARSARSPASTRSARTARRARPASTSSSTSARTSTAPRAKCRRRSTPSRSLLPSALPGMPSYRKINPSQAPIMILALTSDTATTSQLYDLASTVLAQKVRQVTGVGDVTVGGGSLPAVRVELDPRALTQYGISLEDVRRTIQQANILRPKGSVEEGDRYWQIQASDQLTQAADYAPLLDHLSQRRARAADGRRQGHRRRRGSLQHRLLQQQAGGAADRQPPAGREHHQDRRRDQRADADAARVPAGRRAPRRRQRSLAEHPRDAARCRAHAADRRRRSSSWSCCCSWPASAPPSSRWPPCRSR